MHTDDSTSAVGFGFSGKIILCKNSTRQIQRFFGGFGLICINSGVNFVLSFVLSLFYFPTICYNFPFSLFCHHSTSAPGPGSHTIVYNKIIHDYLQDQSNDDTLVAVYSICQPLLFHVNIHHCAFLRLQKRPFPLFRSFTDRKFQIWNFILMTPVTL